MDTLLARGSDVASQLRQAPAVVATAKAAKVADTVEIDRLDGRVYIVVRNLNRAGRRAIRAGNLQAARTDYRFAFTRKLSPPGEPPPAV